MRVWLRGGRVEGQDRTRSTQHAESAGASCAVGTTPQPQVASGHQRCVRPGAGGKPTLAAERSRSPLYLDQACPGPHHIQAKARGSHQACHSRPVAPVVQAVALRKVRLKRGHQPLAAGVLVTQEGLRGCGTEAGLVGAGRRSRHARVPRRHLLQPRPRRAARSQPPPAVRSTTPPAPRLLLLLPLCSAPLPACSPPARPAGPAAAPCCCARRGEEVRALLHTQAPALRWWSFNLTRAVPRPPRCPLPERGLKPFPCGTGGCESACVARAKPDERAEARKRAHSPRERERGRAQGEHAASVLAGDGDALRSAVKLQLRNQARFSHLTA